jgi:hypothetical protein
VHDVSELEPTRPTRAELEAELGTALPDKQVLSLLDLNIDVDLALALASPIDLAIAGNLNVAAPIDAAVSANVLSVGSQAAAQGTQAVMIDQYISGEALATATQDAGIAQGADGGGAGDAAAAAGTSAAADVGSTVDDTVDDAGDTVDDVGDTVDETVDDAVDTGSSIIEGASGTLTDVTSGDLLEGGLLNVDVNVNLDADLAAPIAGAVALNANIAAPIDAAAAANVASIDSEAIAVTNQTAVITQHLDGVTAEAVADQSADVDQEG